MSRVDRTNQLLDQLRAQLAEVTSGRKPGSAPDVARGAGEGKTVSGTATVPLRDVLSKVLKKADLQTDAGRKIARVVFIETVVLDQLGDQLAQDPKFGILVRQIESALSDEKDVLERFDGMLLELSSQ